MRFRHLVAFLLLAAALAMPTTTSGQARKGKDKGVPPAQVIDGDKLPAGEYTGKLTNVPGSDRSFTLTLEKQKLTYTGKGVGKGNNNLNQLIQAQNQMLQAQTQMQNAGNPRQRQQAAQRYTQAYQRYQQAMARANLNTVKKDGLPPGYKMETTKTAVEFQHSENVKVRTLFLPEEFDDKGNVKEWTKAEKEKARGKDKHLPGYESSIDKLQASQVLTVKLATVGKAKPKEKEAEAAAEAEKRHQVTLIVIKTEATEAPKPMKKKKK